MANIYEKLMKCRIELSQKQLKKSGKNSFQNYTYFELGDFLPEILKLFYANKLASIVTYDKEIASLRIIDIDKPEDSIFITSPMEKAALKGCHDIQNLGAVETYQRRYLYVTALEIIENDIIDGQNQNDNTTLLPGQVAELNLIISEKKVDLVKFCNYMGVKNIEDIKQSLFQKAKIALARK